ncbi:MAG: zinc-ribbon domain-containing protein [Bordetella sp.]|nr:zinc-ribbon domain-containing protein [Bordetella sp.]
MILTCPACATSYFVPDEAIGPNGRRVRCKSCGHDWRATLEDVPLELEPQALAAEEAEAAPRYDSFAETPAPELPRVFRAKAERQRRVRQAAAAGAAWAAAAAVALGLLTGGVLFREEIARAFPPAAGVYRSLGLDVNTVGLQFEAQRARTAPHDAGKVVVSAVVRNIRDGEIVAPPIYIALLDAKGAVVASRVKRLDGPPVLPGKVEGFAVVMPDPERKAVGMKVDFVLTPPKPPQAEASPATPRAKTAADSAVREDGGLRR